MKTGGQEQRATSFYETFLFYYNGVLFNIKSYMVLIFVAWSGGCYISTDNEVLTDSTTDVRYDPSLEPVTDPTEETNTPVCGNGIVEGTEQCDDGDFNNCNGCSTNCRWERAMQVDPISPGARVNAAIVPCLTCPFTVEAWFKVEEGIGLFTLFDIPGFIRFSVSTTEYEYGVGDGAGGGGVLDQLSPDSWHHFAVTCAWYGTSWDMMKYIDGEQFGGGRGWSDLQYWTCNEPMSIGSALVDEPFYYPLLPGTIDDLRISNQGLYTYDFVPEQYLEVQSDTVALWTFNSDEGGLMRDVSGNGHDAVLIHGLLVADECHQR